MAKTAILGGIFDRMAGRADIMPGDIFLRRGGAVGHIMTGLAVDAALGDMIVMIEHHAGLAQIIIGNRGGGNYAKDYRDHRPSPPMVSLTVFLRKYSILK